MIFAGTKLRCPENNTGLNLSLHGEKPANNLLRYDTDQHIIKYGKGNRGKKGRKAKYGGMDESKGNCTILSRNKTITFWTLCIALSGDRD
jgi:hypothetical protein